MLRLILIFLWIFLSLVLVGLPALIVFWIIGLFNPALKQKLAQGYAVFISGGITFLAGEKITVHGLENLPRDRAYLLISNHRSLFDIFSAYRFFPGPCASVSKKEWGKIPLLCQLMQQMKCIFLDRSSIRAGLKANQQMEELLKAGISVWICPEGTRNQKDEMLPFHEGSFRAAFQSGAPVLPMTILHTDDLYEQHRPFIRPARVTLVFGRPLETAGLKKAEQKQLIDEVRNEIQETYQRMK